MQWINMNANLVELVQNYHCKPLDQSIKLWHHCSLEFSLMPLSEEQMALESNKATTYNLIPQLSHSFSPHVKYLTDKKAVVVLN